MSHPGPVPPMPPRMRTSPPWAIIIIVVGICAVFFCVVFGGILAAVAIPGFLKAREVSQRNVCQENLVRIEMAKQTWAEDNLIEDYSVAPHINALIGEYLDTMPVCPANGTYTVGSLTQLPQCSVPGHTFPED